MIDEFIEAPEKLSWIVGQAREHNFLPLYVGWVAVLGITPEGEFVRWDFEDRAPVRPLTVPFLQRLTIFEAVKDYPELLPLVPNKPPGAQTCAALCGGTGRVVGKPELICSCGGAGWVIPGEDQGVPPG